jgi:hypothetical protein
VQHSVPYVHTQNSLVESLIKIIKLITRPLLHNCNLPISYWGHAILHIADIIQLRPTTYIASPRHGSCFTILVKFLLRICCKLGVLKISRIWTMRHICLFLNLDYVCLWTTHML